MSTEVPNKNITITRSTAEVAASNPELARELGYQGDISDGPTESPSETPSEPVVEAQEAEATPTEPTSVEEIDTETAGEVTQTDASTDEPVEQEAEVKTEDSDDTPTNFNMDEIASQFAETGAIPDEAKTAISEALGKVEGFDSDAAAKYVDAYEQGLGAIQRVAELEAQIATNELLQSVGGQEVFDKISEWSKANLSAGDVERYDRLLANFDTAGDALSMLKEKYEMATGSARTVVKGDQTPSSDGPEPILSKRDLVRIQKSQEYKESPQFRAQVQARLQAGLNSGQYDPR